MTEFRDLTKLVHPFPQSVVHSNPSGGGKYVKHSTVQQRLLDVLGPVDFTLVQVVRGTVLGKAPNPQGSSARAKEGTPDLHDAAVGAFCRMTATIDGRTVSVEEVGDCEDPYNWPHDGARLKDAMSDAYKRCAMRLGVGLHLWATEDFYLSEKLLKQDRGEGNGKPPAASQTDEKAPQSAPPPPQVPPTPPNEPDGPTAPQPSPGDPVDWAAEAKSLGLVQSQALAAARDLCAELGLPLPASLKQIPAEDRVGMLLFAKLSELAEAKKATV